MKTIKLFATCIALAATMFMFSSCEKEDDPVVDNPTDQNDPSTDDPTDQSIADLIIGTWSITASQESFQYEEGGAWDDVDDAVIGDNFVFNKDKTGWMYFEGEGDFTWSCNGTSIRIDNQGAILTGTVTKIDNNNIKLNIEKPRYKANLTLKRDK